MFKKFFIHIPKNAGMTIRKSPVIANNIITATPQWHKDSAYTNAVQMKMASLGDHHGFEHARWQDLNAEAQSMPAFAVIRNPWDRVVSRFFFAKKVIEVEKKVSASYADVSSFEAFLEERHKWGNEPYMWHRAVRGWYPAFDHVVDPATNNISKQISILRFEHLNEDLCRFFAIAQMSRARNVTALNTGSYKDLYTATTIQIVADWYAKDIETWGYDFASGPTRNTTYNEVP